MSPLGVGDTLYDGLESFLAHTPRQRAWGVQGQNRDMRLLRILHQREVVLDELWCRLDTLLKRGGVACACQVRIDRWLHIALEKFHGQSQALGATLCQNLEHTQLECLDVGMVMLFAYRHDLGLSHGLDKSVEGQHSLGGQFYHRALQLGATGGGHHQARRRRDGNPPGTGCEEWESQEQDEEASLEGSRHSLPSAARVRDDLALWYGIMD